MKRNSPNPLDSSVQFLKGIGPSRFSALEKHGITTVGDLLFHVPRRYLDKTLVVTVAQLRQHASRIYLETRQEKPEQSPLNRFYTIVAEVRSFRVIGFRSKSRFVMVAADDTGSVQCVWFGGVQYWKNRFKVGELLALSGTPSYYGNVLQFVHPDVDRLGLQDGEGEKGEMDLSNMLNTGRLVPLYPSNSDFDRVRLDSAGMRRVIRSALTVHSGTIPDALPIQLRRTRGLAPIDAAFQHVHFPENRSQLESGLHRLKYEEFFLFQLMLALQRRRLKQETKGISFFTRSRLARQLVDALPFELTRAQKRVIREIAGDMEAPTPLNRLLQGDVGSGKTIVALVAMLIAVENGYQAAFMAPTEILAEQHFRTLKSFLGSIDVNVRLLVGKQRSRLRKDVLMDVQRGSAQIVVGTHALFESDVEFARLGFIVIDEQHRFGVMQRASLRGKGEHPDVLVMTATPIPRTLSLTLYGELDISVIDELPRNRKPIETSLRYDDEKEEVYRFTRDQVSRGRQAYFVYPVIEESEKPDLKAATVHFEHLRSKVFPGFRLGLLHGRLPNEEKEGVMERFKQGEIDILVATTVIEVGIDVPNAVLMVIENAERFGLSQLHQLRGRVGRGGEKSYCILLSGSHRHRIPRETLLETDDQNESQAAEKRLATMVSTTDGFRIAEVDLQLRGPGDFFGTRQSGVPLFRVANLITDGRILDQARHDAFAIVEQDPRLEQPEHLLLSTRVEHHYREAARLLGTA